VEADAQAAQACQLPVDIRGKLLARLLLGADHDVHQGSHRVPMIVDAWWGANDSGTRILRPWD
jgi:hypothetical protein